MQLANLPKVTHLSFLYEAHILLVVCDQLLLAYELDLSFEIKDGNVFTHVRDGSLDSIPQRVSGTNKVLCFTVANFQDQELVIYAIRKPWGSTVFKVLQVSQKRTVFEYSTLLKTLCSHQSRQRIRKSHS